MNNQLPLQIGVTGGIGSGKSLVCKVFSILGVPVYNADARGRWLTNNDPEIRKRLIEVFGAPAFKNNELDRDYVAKIVFNDHEKLELLNSIIHPRVGEDYKSWISDQQANYVIKEAALMFESKAHLALDKIVNVSAPETLRINRVLHRDRFRTEKEIKSIISKQLTDSEREEKSDYTLHNDEKELVIPQVLQLHDLFK